MNGTLYQRFTLPLCPEEWLIPPWSGLPFMLTDRATPTRPVVDSRVAQTCVWPEACEGGKSVFGWQLAHTAFAWVMDTAACSISLPTNQPYMILHLQMQNIPIRDAVIKWWFNIASVWLERKQPIHLTNEVISAIGWPCRFTYGHYAVCEALSELYCMALSWGRMEFWMN